MVWKEPSKNGDYVIPPKKFTNVTVTNIFKLITMRLFSLLFVYFLGVFYSTFTWGLVLQKFYSWFIDPLFSYFPRIDYVQAMGMMLFISLFNAGDYRPVKTDELEDYIIFKVFAPWTVLFSGWIVKIVLF